MDSCWINFFDPDAAAKELGLPENEEILMFLDLGHAAEGGKPLPNRTNIVLTSQTDFAKEGCIVVHDMDELAAVCADYAPEDMMVIGGEQIYMQLIRQCDRLFITKIFESFDADKHLMNVDKMRSFELVWTGDVQEENGIQYQFLEYRKKEKDLSNGKSQE